MVYQQAGFEKTNMLVNTRQCFSSGQLSSSFLGKLHSENEQRQFCSELRRCGYLPEALAVSYSALVLHSPGCMDPAFWE